MYCGHPDTPTYTHTTEALRRRGSTQEAATEARGTEEGGPGGTRQQKPVEHGMCQLPRAVETDLAMWPNHKNLIGQRGPMTSQIATHMRNDYIP